MTEFDESKLPRVDELSEEEIYKILDDDAQNIEPPESLSPRSIEEKLIGVQQTTKRRTSPIVMIAGMAACLVLGVMAGFLTFSLIRSSEHKTDSPTEPDTVANFGNYEVTAPFSGTEYDELTYPGVCEIINSYNEQNRREYYVEDYVEEAIPDEAPAVEEEAGSSFESNDAPRAIGGTQEKTSDYSRTDEQVHGVEEGDIVKTDGRYIYTVESSTFGYLIHIIQPDGNRSRELGSIEIGGSYVSEMYVAQNNLIAIGTDWTNGQAKTSINFIDISDPSAPSIRHTLTQSGNYNTSRLSGGYLYTFTEDQYYSEGRFKLDAPRDYVPKLNDELIPAGRIVRAGEDDSNNYMVMTSVPLNGDDGFTDTLAVLGGGATYYVSTEHIYISRINNLMQMEKDFFSTPYSPITSLTKFTYEEGCFSKDASTTFRGQINDSYYMHEYQGNFCFVYTSFDNSGESTNGLCILDENLNKTGELRKIAPGETIYSSYFIENMAYFVTYRNTDPVFAVDISNPHNPVLKSELKLPGFSSYLHSFGPDKLIGIGYGNGSQEGWDGWDGTTKLSLFKIGADYSIEELSKIFADQGARNIADRNHKAVFVDEQRMIVGMGLQRYIYNDENEDNQTHNSYYYTAYVLKGNEFVKVLDTSTDAMIGDLPMEDTRGVRIGEIFYICNSTGVVMAYDITTDGKKWKETK